MPHREDAVALSASRAWTAWALICAAAVLALRAALAVRVPLSGDEAYYWEWSRRLAAGYHDHPPMVAWIIALFDRGLHEAFLVRFGFILCGAVAALALAAFAWRAAGNRRAGAIAIVLLSIVPMFSIAFATATPDGPYLAGWALSLMLAQRAFETDEPTSWMALGAALGATILSRLLGIALLIGIAVALLDRRRQRGLRIAGPLVAVAALLAVISPYLAWNAVHHWDTLTFTVSRAAPVGGFYPLGPLSLVAIIAAAASPGLLIVGFWAISKTGGADADWAKLVLWTSAPLALGLTALSLFHTVEVYWFFGPLVGAVAAAAIVSSRVSLGRIASISILAPAVAELLLILLFAVAPARVYAFVRQTRPSIVAGNGPFEIFAYPALGREIGRRARASDAWVVTDGYGLSSVMDFYGGVPPVAVGANPQGRESRSWYDPSRVSRVFYFVDHDPLSRRGIDARLRSVCPVLRPDVLWHYHFGQYDDAVAFYVTTCSGVSPAGFRRFAQSRTWK